MNPQSTFARELEVAVAAAQVAGGILREAFNQPGGPKGSPGHADADRDAEVAIRDALAGAFPEDGYLGEELYDARRAPGREGRLWVVDPNDGTSAYMKGFRGAATSIALLVKGQPVLGVVYAYNYPDDRGDLLAWAEGGPLLRNGVPTAPAWPASLDSDCVVLLSQSADKSPGANAACIAPMRYRAMPSIAYRLALAAAGDGVAGASIYGPGTWDFAGGHALLLGAGGDLFSRDGTPVRYDPDGSCRSSAWVFGGSPPHVDHIRGSDWSAVLDEVPADGPYGLCFPRSGGGPLDPAMHARAQGCLLGQLAGDALGSLVEFQGPDAIAARYPGGVRELADGGTHHTIAGQPTDDSEMALLLARSLIEHGAYEPDPVRHAYVYWLESGPFDCGITIGNALRGGYNYESQANGALMRISPLGIFGVHHAPHELADWARQDAVLTHPHPVCQEVNALFAMAIAHAIRTGCGPGSLCDQIAEWAREMDCLPPVVETIEAARTAPPDDYITLQGWVLIAFQNALWQLQHASGFTEAVVDTVMRGGDTDTNAAICGALMGAMHGFDAIPAQWRDRVLTCRPIGSLPDVHRPRPRCFWPVDALILVDRLLAAG
jgi:ADP-ribosylglycohydrolase/fructose-1,6-bisphosphatase/inositol monophosphatase family enzyme